VRISFIAGVAKKKTVSPPGPPIGHINEKTTVAASRAPEFKVVTASEPSSYIWSFSFYVDQREQGGITIILARNEWPV